MIVQLRTKVKLSLAATTAVWKHAGTLFNVLPFTPEVASARMKKNFEKIVLSMFELRNISVALLKLVKLRLHPKLIHPELLSLLG